MRKYLPLLVGIAILEILTVFLIGYTVVEPYPMIYILVCGFLLIAATAFLLKNIQLAVYLLIILLPIYNIKIFLHTESIKAMSMTWLMPLHLKPSSLENDWLVTLLNIAVVCAVICWLFYKSVVKGQPTTIEKACPGYMNMLLFLLVTWSGFSVLWSPEIHVGLYAGIELFLNFFMYLLLIFLIKTESDINKVVRVYIFMAVITAIAMMISVIPSDSLSIDEKYTLSHVLRVSLAFTTNVKRASGFAETHIAAMIVDIGILFGMGLLSHSKSKTEKVILFSVIAFLFFTTLFTQTRAPLAALLMGMGYLILVIKNFRAFLIRNLYIFAVGFIFLFGIYIMSQLELMDILGLNKAAPSRYLSTSQTEDAITSRYKYWKQVFKAVENKEAYIYGLGAGGSTYTLYPTPHPHNVYLSVFFDFGLIGFMLMLILILLATAKIVFIIRELEDGYIKTMLISLSGCMVTLGAECLLDFDYNLPLAWILMGIGVAIYRYAVSTQKANAPLPVYGR